MRYERSTVPNAKVHIMANDSPACGAKKSKRVKIATEAYALIGLTENSEDLLCKACFNSTFALRSTGTCKHGKPIEGCAAGETVVCQATACGYFETSEHTAPRYCPTHEQKPGPDDDTMCPDCKQYRSLDDVSGRCADCDPA